MEADCLLGAIFQSPQTPLDRLRAGCKPHRSTHYQSLHPARKRQPFQISKMYICATNDLANLSLENAFWRLAR